MPLCIFAMMLYFENFSMAMWIYASLHGTYGIFWLLKDFTFPDSSFERKHPIVVVLVAFFGVLMPYAYGSYLIASGASPQTPSAERIFVAVVMYTFGLVFMLGADG